MAEQSVKTKKSRSRSFGDSHSSSVVTGSTFLKPPAFTYLAEDTIDDELKCSVCKLPLRQPVVSGCCRHTFCKSCLSSNSCPDCKGNVVPLTDAPKLVVNLLGRIEVKCSTCEKIVKRDDFANHNQNHCEIQCPWGCTSTIIRGKVNQHEPECPNQPVSCTASDLGCTLKVPRNELEKHITICHFVNSRPLITKLNKLEKLSKSLESTLKRHENALAILCENSNQSHRDLSNKDLSHLNFSGADFTNSNLSGTNFTNSNLTKANLTKANLSDAILTNANLTKAVLNGTNLTNTKLTKATLQCLEGCKQTFKYGETKYHPGKFKFMSEWSCCDKPDFNAPGCQTCNHRFQ